jgi:hypothetical protein
MTNEDYVHSTDQPLDLQTMEALAAEAEEGVDMNQVIRHNQYIGWVLGIARTHGLVEFVPAGGNRFDLRIADELSVTLVIPYPPEEWQP